MENKIPALYFLLIPMITVLAARWLFLGLLESLGLVAGLFLLFQIVGDLRGRRRVRLAQSDRFGESLKTARRMLGD